MENKGKQVRRHGRPLQLTTACLHDYRLDPVSWSEQAQSYCLFEKPQISAQAFCCTQCTEKLAGNMTSALYMHLQKVYGKCRKCLQLFKSTEMCCHCFPGMEQSIMN